MSAPKTCLPRASNYRFLPADHAHANDSMIFELDESDVWNTATLSASPEYLKKSARVSSRKPSVAGTRRVAGSPSSLPVNVPDWSKILKDEYRENRSKDSADDYEGNDAGEMEDWVPPHEFLARQMAMTRIGSFSVHEGIGRTLKGRELRRVRNAIWQKTGFQD
ncbi:protein S40-4-like [Primulina huaijiensis]|uniref:protein S40-4-like n=1 Tax=Primulina huaijiensis TaxID=1492673 RepID=UPI003CC70D40